jgi:signal transduction histidine kinase
VGPLNAIPTLKMKLSIVIVAAIAVTALLSGVNVGIGIPLWLGPILAAVVSLVMVHFLAKGTTYPLRQMAEAADSLVGSDYQRRITTASSDEVGQLANSFNAMVAELAEVERQRRELVANVSHELRTPIAAIQMNLENLVDGVTEWDTGRGEVMLRQTERLTRLVTQLLDLAKLEAGSAPLELQSFASSTLLEAVRAESELHERPVNLEISATPDLTVVGDVERLHQLLANLVDNAVHHSPDGGTVELSAVPHGEGVRFTVADNGPGIPPEERERIFERFHRVDAGRSTSSGGSGLGLSIARWIVDLHGGSIAATENRPTGARMVVDLPASPTQRSVPTALA